MWMVETQLCKLRGTSDIYTNYRSPVFYVSKTCNSCISRRKSEGWHFGFYAVRLHQNDSVLYNVWNSEFLTVNRSQLSVLDNLISYWDLCTYNYIITTRTRCKLRTASSIENNLKKLQRLLDTRYNLHSRVLYTKYDTTTAVFHIS